MGEGELVTTRRTKLLGLVQKKGYWAHPSVIIDPKASIGKGSTLWAFAQVRERARIGKNCILGMGVYIDRDVAVGDRVRIHNKASLYQGLVVEDDVFIGPHAVFTNDKLPHFDRIRTLKGIRWRVKRGAAIGAGATVLPDVTIGEFSLVGAGAVVTKDVPPQGLVYGNPAQLHGYICRCGKRIADPIAAASFRKRVWSSLDVPKRKRQNLQCTECRKKS